MDLSYEARWDNLRRQIEDDIAALNERATEAEDEGDLERAEYLDTRASGLSRAILHMDAADRVGAHRA